MLSIERLIERMYNGYCSKQELEQLMDLLKRDQNFDFDRILNKLWEDSKTSELTQLPLNSNDLNTEIQKRIVKIDSSNRKAQSTVFDLRTKKKRKWYASIAAGILILICSFAWMYLSQSKLQMVQTTYAEQETVILPDKSEVVVNANSVLKFQKNWHNEHVRKVWLEGEAYFSIEKSPSKQEFHVITNDLTVQVLGTIFNVNTRKASTQVYLEEGKINLDLKNLNDEVLLEPGDLMEYSKLTRKSIKKKIENEVPASWKDGTVILTNVRLQEIVNKINEIYSISVVVQNPDNLERKFSIYLPVDDRDMGFKVLSGIGLEIVNDNNTWIIK